MLPTCPFRTSVHLDDGFSRDEEDDDSVVSLTTVDFPIALIVDIENQYINLDENSALITGNHQIQNHKVNIGLVVDFTYQGGIQ